jgi:asparagine synthase (glutamine-hydrolysing)
MCGIAGIYRFRGDGTGDRQAVPAMLLRLVRRGPDGQGLLEEGRATLGHRRLKIIDLTDAGRQPMADRTGRFVMVYNGEVYNYRELQAELGLAPGQLRSTSDTEVLVEGWAAWGPAVLDRIVGQFAFAVYDKREERLWIARDRFGEKPLFYHADGGRVAFASSIGALLAAPGVPGELDPAALQEYVTLRYVVAPRTVMRDVRKLPGGCLLEASPDGMRVSRWHEPHYHGTRRLLGRASRHELAEEFGRLLEQATRRCLVADVRTALLLSDGIDSNAIRTLLTEIDPEAPCFTYGYRNVAGPVTMPRGPGKSQAAVRRYEYAFSVEDRLDAMREAFAGLTEPVGDGASLATWLLLRKASADAKVFLCGHGSDEFLGGYRLSQDRLRLRFLRYVAHLPQAAAAKPLDRFLYGSEPLAARLGRFRAAARDETPAAARYLIHRPLPVGDVRQLVDGGQAFDDGAYLRSVGDLYGTTRPDAPDLDRIQEVMIRTFLAENILSFADSVAMDSSVELRMPFLDRDLVAFAKSLPPAARVGALPGTGNTKRILRWWGATHLDPEMVAKRKQTFNFGSLRPLLQSHGPQLKSYILDSPAVRRALPGVEAWLQHPPEYYRDCWQGTMWALLALGLWCPANGVRA